MLFTRQENADDPHGGFVFYHYEVSMAAAVIFALLFGIATIWHAIQMFATRTWFMIPFLLGGIFETIGYIGRGMSSTENPGPYTLSPYIMQSVLLLVAPALFAASIYMELGRIVLMVDGERALFIRRTWLTKLFVAGDVLSFLMQSSGAGLLATADDLDGADMGNNIIIGGLVVQVTVFGLFVVASAIFHTRTRANPTAKCHTMPWEKHMISLYVVSTLILVRSIVRLVEYAQGHEGYIITHEIFLYIFDALVMWIAVVVMNMVHPSEVAACLRGGKAFVKAWKMEDLGYTGRAEFSPA